MSSSTIEILRAARALIERPECWTRFANARNRAGDKVSAADPTAVCWCALGALERVTPTGEPTINAERALNVAGPGFLSFNDAVDRTHAEILEWFDRAIAQELLLVSA